MTETIDVSEWLHQSFHKAYPYAMQHSTESNGRYRSLNQLMFDQLYDIKILTDWHLASAEFLYSLYEVATSKSGYARILNIIHNHPNGDNIKGFCPTTLLKMIYEDMNRLQWSQVERICIKDVRGNDIGWIELCRDSIRIAFDDLGQSIEKSIDMLKERLQNV